MGARGSEKAGAHRPSLAGTVQGERTSCQSQRVQRRLGLSCWVPNEPCQEVPGLVIFPGVWGSSSRISKDQFQWKIKHALETKKKNIEKKKKKKKKKKKS